MIIAAPSDEHECRQLLTTAYQYHGPAAVRYPRGKGTGALTEKTLSSLTIGQAKTIRNGQDIAIVNFGTLLPEAVKAAEILNATVCDMRWVKPLDKECLQQLASSHQLLVTLEDNTIAGGAGSAVIEYLSQQGILIPVLLLGLPDTFIDHGKRDDILAAINLDASGICETITHRQQQLK
jgi:1-deoxy-D-xylulose-5-phosphate synthase